MKRQPDGTFRNVRQPTVVSADICRSGWIEREATHLKLIGLPFDAIAEQITRVARGETKAMTAIPDGVTFPPDFRISRQACHKAFRRAIAREPALEVEELRKLDRARSEEMYLNLQPGIRRGDLRAVEVGIRLLDHAAKINGYAAPQKHEVTGKDGKPLSLIPIELARRVLEELDDEE
jgi:hypothetical protein